MNARYPDTFGSRGGLGPVVAKSYWDSHDGHRAKPKCAKGRVIAPAVADVGQNTQDGEQHDEKSDSYPMQRGEVFGLTARRCMGKERPAEHQPAMRKAHPGTEAGNPDDCDDIKRLTDDAEGGAGRRSCSDRLPLWILLGGGTWTRTWLSDGNYYPLSRECVQY